MTDASAISRESRPVRSPNPHHQAMSVYALYEATKALHSIRFTLEVNGQLASHVKAIAPVQTWAEDHVEAIDRELLDIAYELESRADLSPDGEADRELALAMIWPVIPGPAYHVEINRGARP